MTRSRGLEWTHPEGSRSVPPVRPVLLHRLRQIRQRPLSFRLDHQLRGETFGGDARTQTATRAPSRYRHPGWQRPGIAVMQVVSSNMRGYTRTSE